MILQADVESSFGCIFLLYLPHHTLSSATLQERTPTSSETPPWPLAWQSLFPSESPVHPPRELRSCLFPFPHGRARSTPPSLTSQSFLLFRSGPPGDPFSLDECRSLVALMDVSFAVTIHPPLPPSTESLSAPSSSPRI